MKRVVLFFMWSVVMAMSLPSVRGSALLEWERSTDLKNWERVPASELLFTQNGGLVVATTAPKTAYRLRISEGTSGGFVRVLPIAEAPKEAVQIATQFLADFQGSATKAEAGDSDANWPEDAQLGPMCYPVYDASVDGGKNPAYLEFKVIKRPFQSDIKPDPSLPMSPPYETDDNRAYGYILVSLTMGDMPVPEFSDRGASKVERLLGKVRGGNSIKPMRFDGGLLMAEDENGELVGNIGNEPVFIDPKVLEVAGKEFSGFADNGGTQGGDSPKFPARRFESYKELKEQFVNGPLFQFLRNERAVQAQPQWTLVHGGPTIFQVALQKTERVLVEQKVQQATLDDPSVASLKFEVGRAGVAITGVELGGTVLRVRFSDGTSDNFVVSVTKTAGALVLPAATADWGPWSYNYAGSFGDTRRYSQFSSDPQMCPGGASGCGPTAWAMLYGWWDLRGSPRLMANSSLADAPLYNNSSVLDCTRYVFSRVGPFCVSGQAATMPWSMSEGYRWASFRGAGYSISWSWGLPYVSPGVRNQARDSIRAGRPSIVGLGFYWHYPLAYGYATRNYTFLGITWDTAHYFKCNMGWGGSSPEWQNGNSTWFSTNARYF